MGAYTAAIGIFLSLMSLPVEVKLAAVSEADFAPGHFCVIQCGSTVSNCHHSRWGTEMWASLE